MDRLDEACELDQKSVTRRFDNSSAMPIDAGLKTSRIAARSC
jgi:hypothetical protein